MNVKDEYINKKNILNIIEYIYNEKLKNSKNTNYKKDEIEYKVKYIIENKNNFVELLDVDSYKRNYLSCINYILRNIEIFENEKNLVSKLLSISNKHIEYKNLPQFNNIKFIKIFDLVEKHDLINEFSKLENIIFREHNKEILEKLFKIGLDPNIKNHNNDNLFAFIKMDDLETVKYLKEKKCNILNLGYSNNNNYQFKLSFENSLDNCYNYNNINKYFKIVLSDISSKDLQNVLDNKTIHPFLYNILKTRSYYFEYMYNYPEHPNKIEIDNCITSFLKIFKEKNVDFSNQFSPINSNNVYNYDNLIEPFKFSLLIKMGLKKRNILKIDFDLFKSENITRKLIQSDLFDAIKNVWHEKPCKFFDLNIFHWENDIYIDKLIKNGYMKDWIELNKENPEKIVKGFFQITKSSVLKKMLDNFPEFYDLIKKVCNDKNETKSEMILFNKNFPMLTFMKKLPKGDLTENLLINFFEYSDVFHISAAKEIRKRFNEQLTDFLIKYNHQYFYSNNLVKSFIKTHYYQKNKSSLKNLDDFVDFMKSLNVDCNPFDSRNLKNNKIKDYDVIPSLVINYFNKPNRLFKDLFEFNDDGLLKMNFKSTNVIKNINEKDESGYTLFDYASSIAELNLFDSIRKNENYRINDYCKTIRELYNLNYNFNNQELELFNKITKKEDKLTTSLIEKVVLINSTIESVQQQNKSEQKRYILKKNM